MPLFPPVDDEPQAAANLKGRTKEKGKFNDRLAVELACNLHEGDVRRDASQGRKVVRDMKAGEGRDKNGRCSVKRTEFHLKTANKVGDVEQLIAMTDSQQRA